MFQSLQRKLEIRLVVESSGLSPKRKKKASWRERKVAGEGEDRGTSKHCVVV